MFILEIEFRIILWQLIIPFTFLFRHWTDIELTFVRQGDKIGLTFVRQEDKIGLTFIGQEDKTGLTIKSFHLIFFLQRFCGPINISLRVGIARPNQNNNVTLELIAIYILLSWDTSVQSAILASFSVVTLSHSCKKKVIIPNSKRLRYLTVLQKQKSLQLCIRFMKPMSFKPFW